MDEDKRIIWCGNLSSKVTEELLYELFIQAAPVERVKVVKSRNPNQSSFGFVTLKHLNSVIYATKLLDGATLFNRKVIIKPRDGIEPVNIPPILPPIPIDESYEKLFESPTNHEHRNFHREDRHNARHERIRNERPYRSYYNQITHRGHNRRY